LGGLQTKDDERLMAKEKRRRRERVWLGHRRPLLHAANARLASNKWATR
jgi:hypothetical protein